MMLSHGQFVFDVRPRSAADALTGGPRPAPRPPWVYGAIAGGLALLLVLRLLPENHRRGLLGAFMMLLAIGGELALVIIPIAAAWLGASRLARGLRARKDGDARA